MPLRGPCAPDLIVIAGESPPLVSFDFGTALVAEAGRPASAPPSAPCGLSAVSKNTPSWLACSLAVAAFPPRRLRTVKTPFRKLSGTMRPSDSSCPFVISSFRPRRLPHTTYRCGGQEVSPGKQRGTSCRLRCHYDVPPTDIGLYCCRPAYPWDARLTALRFRSVRHCIIDFHQTPIAGKPLS